MGLTAAFQAQQETRQPIFLAASGGIMPLGSIRIGGHHAPEVQSTSGKRT
jgi:hypothetical protein